MILIFMFQLSKTTLFSEILSQSNTLENNREFYKEMTVLNGIITNIK